MNPIRPISFVGLLALSGLVAYFFFSPNAPDIVNPPSQTESSKRSVNEPAVSPRTLKPLLLEEPRPSRIDPTNYEVTVSDLALQPIGEKIEDEARTRLQKLTARYQLSVNQRREAFPLIVSHHPDYTPGLVVNGFSSSPPEARDFSTRFSEILNLTQRELFQEDLGADQAWWRDVLTQIREDIEGPPPTDDPDDSVNAPIPRTIPGD